VSEVTLTPWRTERLNHGALRRNRSPLDGRPTVPWARWVLADLGYVLHVTYDLGRDGPWRTVCGSQPQTSRIVPLLRGQAEWQLCQGCSGSSHPLRTAIAIVAGLEGFVRVSRRRPDGWGSDDWLEYRPHEVTWRPITAGGYR